MNRRFVFSVAAACMALALACSKSSETPTSPSSATPGATAAQPDGVTLKATAPTPVSPVNGAQPDSLVLTVNKGTAKYDASQSLAQEFQVMTASGTPIAA